MPVLKRGIQKRDLFLLRLTGLLVKPNLFSVYARTGFLGFMVQNLTSDSGKWLTYLVKNIILVLDISDPIYILGSIEVGLVFSTINIHVTLGGFGLSSHYPHLSLCNSRVQS